MAERGRNVLVKKLLMAKELARRADVAMNPQAPVAVRPRPADPPASQWMAERRSRKNEELERRAYQKRMRQQEATRKRVIAQIQQMSPESRAELPWWKKMILGLQ